MADEVASLTIEILKQIRDGVTHLGSRVDETNARLSSVEANLSSRLDETNARLSSVEAGLNELKVAVLRMARVNDAVLDEQMKDTEKLDGHEARLDRLEKHVGIPPSR